MPCILAMEQKFKKIKYMCPQACSNQYGRNQCALPASVSVPPLFTISDVQLQACPDVVRAAAAVDVTEQRAAPARCLAFALLPVPRRHSLGR